MRPLLAYPAPVVFALAISLLFVYAGWLTLDFPPEHRLVPSLIVIPGFAISLLVLVAELRTASSHSEATPESIGSNWVSDAGRLAWVALFIGAVTAFGFVIGLPLAVLGFALKAGERPLTSLALAASAVVIVAVFASQFQLRFPPGVVLNLF